MNKPVIGLETMIFDIDYSRGIPMSEQKFNIQGIVLTSLTKNESNAM